MFYHFQRQNVGVQYPHIAYCEEVVRTITIREILTGIYEGEVLLGGDDFVQKFTHLLIVIHLSTYYRPHSKKSIVYENYKKRNKQTLSFLALLL